MPGLASVVDRLTSTRRRLLLAYALAALAFVVLPFAIDTITANQILILAIFALGYNLLLGYGGEMSFGHAMFYGSGAYVTIILMNSFGIGFYPSMVLAVVATGLLGAVIGWLSLHKRGVYFAMITLAFGQMVYFLAFSFQDLTGGSNGIYFPAGANTAVAGIDPANSQMTFYATCLTLLIIVILGMYRIVHSPFGRALNATGENEERAKHLGYDTDRLLLVSFTFSAIIGGFAGTLFVLLFKFVSPGVLFWSQSGEILLMTVLGGVGTLSGPILGAAVFGVMDSYLSELTRNWPILFGALFIVVVRFAPDGIRSILVDVYDRAQNYLER